MTLFELTAEYKYILEMAEDPEADPDIISTHLEDISLDIKDKADNIAHVLTQLAGDIETIKKEEERLYGIRTRLTGNMERLKVYLENSMRETGMVKFKTAYHSFRIQKNPQSVRILEGQTIPEQYLIPQPPKVDKRAILADLKAGKEFPFAELYQSEGVRIS